MEVIGVVCLYYRGKQIFILFCLTANIINYHNSMILGKGSDGQLEKHVMYCRWYLDNLCYLKELKSQFDKRVYLPLEQNMCDSTTARRKQSVDRKSSEDCESILEFKHSCPDIRDLYDYSDLTNIVGRLGYLRDRLNHLLEDEGEIDADLFSVNSVLNHKDDNSDDRFLRLVPDILVKLQKAATLAQQWLDIAATKDFDEGTRLTKLERVKTILGDRLANIDDEIQAKQKELSVESSDLKELRKREERSSNISNQNQSLETKINRSLEKIDRTSRQISDIEDLITTAAGNKQFNHQLTQELKKKKKEQNELNRKLRILEFEREIAAEDLCLELEIKPELIRQTSSLQDKCEHLESILETMRLEKERLVLALKPVIDDKSKAQSKVMFDHGEFKVNS